MDKVNITLITNRNLVVTDEEYFNIISKALENNISNIIFREKNLDYEKQKFYYKRIKLIKKEKNSKCNIIINSNKELYYKLGADAFHLSFIDFKNLSEKERENKNIGVSVHSLEEAIKASKLGAKYILVSNIYETKCKEGLEGKGVEFLKDIKTKVNCEIIALGGIDESNIKELKANGFYSVALMSSLMESKNIERTIRNLKNS